MEIQCELCHDDDEDDDDVDDHDDLYSGCLKETSQ